MGMWGIERRVGEFRCGLNRGWAKASWLDPGPPRRSEAGSLHRGIAQRARGRRVDVELPVKSLRRQHHRALRKGRNRQERADADRRGDRRPVAYVEPVVNARRALRWIEHPPIRRHDALLYRFTHRASAEGMGNDPVAAERGHGEGVADEYATHAFDHRPDLLLRSHAFRRGAVAGPVDYGTVVVKPHAAARVVVRDDVENLRPAHLVAVDTLFQ